MDVRDEDNGGLSYNNDKGVDYIYREMSIMLMVATMAMTMMTTPMILLTTELNQWS